MIVTRSYISDFYANLPWNPQFLSEKIRKKVLKNAPEKKRNNIKENIRKLKEIYHKNCRNFLKNEVFSKNESIKEERTINDFPLKKEAVLNNFKKLVEFFRKPNFSNPNSKKNNNFEPFSHGKNASLIKRIDFDNKLNYSLLQKKGRSLSWKLWEKQRK